MRPFQEDRDQLIEQARTDDLELAVQLAPAFKHLDALARAEGVEWQGRQVSLSTALARARALGNGRDPRKTDVFVHMEWPWDPSARTQIHKFFRLSWDKTSYPIPREWAMEVLVEEWCAAFADAMRSLLAEARHPLVVDCARLVADAPTFAINPHRAVRSAHTDRGLIGQVSTGELARIAEILEGLSQADPVRVHGAAAYRCVMSWMDQYLAARELGVFLPDLDHSGAERRDDVRDVVNPLREAMQRFLYPRVDVRAGTVFDVPLDGVWQDMHGRPRLGGQSHRGAVILPPSIDAVAADLRRIEGHDGSMWELPGAESSAAPGAWWLSSLLRKLRLWRR